MEGGHYLRTLANEARQNNKREAVSGICAGTESPNHQRRDMDLSRYWRIKADVPVSPALSLQVLKKNKHISALQRDILLVSSPPRTIDQTCHLIDTFFFLSSSVTELNFFFSKKSNKRPKSNVKF